MRILHYVPDIDHSSGGVGSYMQMLTKCIGRAVNLHIVTHKSDNPLQLDGCYVHYIESFVHPLKMKKSYERLLESLAPDVVHVNGCWMPACAYTVIWAKKQGFKVVLTPHGMLEPWDIKKNYWTKKLPALLLYQKRAVKMADLLIATSEPEKDNLKALKYNRHIAVIPNGIPIETIQLKKSWNKKNTILYLGLLRANKGADLLIEAVAKMKDELRGYKVTIAGPQVNGEEGYYLNLQNLIRDNQLNNVVTLSEGIYGKEKWLAYQNSDLFVLPTLNENFGIVIAESLLSGTPVITCKGAPWPQLETCNCGWWVERNVDSIVAAIRKAIVLSPQELEMMGRNGRRLVEGNYSSEKIGNELVKLYSSIIGS